MSISLTRGETAAAETGRAQSSRRSWPLMLGAAVAAIVAVASFALPWGAARDTELAVSGWTTNPQVALDRLERARSLNFLSAEPDILAGTIAVRLGDDATARTAFERALRRQPDNWFARLQLGTLAAVEGDRATALSQLSEAIEANPRDSLLQKAYRRARRGNPLELEDIDRELAGRVCDRVGRTSDTDFCE
jgi:Flp pilus assembly protein TadD